MKNLIKVALLATGIFAAAQTRAQTHRDTTAGQKLDRATRAIGHATTKTVKAVGHATTTGVNAVGHKTSELATKGAAAITDKKYDGKAGPNNENVYIDSKARYYYVDKSGHRVYITKAEMKTKVED